jgi:hypothetical protein
MKQDEKIAVVVQECHTHVLYVVASTRVVDDDGTVQVHIRQSAS